MRTAYGKVSLAQLAPQRLQESTLHSWDIARADDLNAGLDQDAVPLLLDVVLATAGPLVAKGMSEARDGTYRLDLSGPGGGPVTLRVQGGRSAPNGAWLRTWTPA